MQNGVYFEKDISILGYLHNEKVFSYKLLSIFIIHQDLSFGGIALKIEFVVFVYELINYEIIFFITLLCNYQIQCKTINVKHTGNSYNYIQL